MDFSPETMNEAGGYLDRRLFRPEWSDIRLDRMKRNVSTLTAFHHLLRRHRTGAGGPGNHWAHRRVVKCVHGTLPGPAPSTARPPSRSPDPAERRHRSPAGPPPDRDRGRSATARPFGPLPALRNRSHDLKPRNLITRPEIPIRESRLQTSTTRAARGVAGWHRGPSWQSGPLIAPDHPQRPAPKPLYNTACQA